MISCRRDWRCSRNGIRTRQPQTERLKTEFKKKNETQWLFSSNQQQRSELIRIGSIVKRKSVRTKSGVRKWDLIDFPPRLQIKEVMNGRKRVADKIIRPIRCEWITCNTNRPHNNFWKNEWNIADVNWFDMINGTPHHSRWNNYFKQSPKTMWIDSWNFLADKRWQHNSRD